MTSTTRDDDGRITRESLERWLDCHAGDFSEIIDFYASIEDGDLSIDLPWSSEESEITFNGAMYSEDD